MRVAAVSAPYRKLLRASITTAGLLNSIFVMNIFHINYDQKSYLSVQIFCEFRKILIH